jgi:cardiolipin synthase A/B
MLSAHSSISLQLHLRGHAASVRTSSAELARAAHRGVEVRVIVDDAGTRYSWPPVTRVLAAPGRAGAPLHAQPAVLRLITMNLRNHKKILVVDGRIAFTGGMNIREGNMLARRPPHPVQDLHFRVTGPCRGSAAARLC